MPKLSLACAAIVAATLLLPLQPSRAVEETGSARDRGSASGLAARHRIMA